jgi:hypothetical protein
MQSILDNIAKRRQQISPQNVPEYIAFQMAIKAGDPFLFYPYLRKLELIGVGRCIDIFKRDRKLPINE